MAEGTQGEKPIKLPDDITEDERKDFERTGTLELYELNREGSKLAQERVKLTKELADRAQAEADKRAKRHQLEQQRLENEALKAKLLAPPPPDPYADSKPLKGSEKLPEVVKGVIRRLFEYSGGAWTAENQQGLVDLLVAMGPAKAQQWAYQMRDALATDAYGMHELSPKAILKGSTGLKQIAGPALMPDLKAIGGPVDDVKQISDGRGGAKKKRLGDKKKAKKGSSRRHEEDDDEEEEIEEHDEENDEVIDDSPMGNAESPWGDGGYSH
jgi:hypothetical protein